MLTAVDHLADGGSGRRHRLLGRQAAAVAHLLLRRHAAPPAGPQLPAAALERAQVPPPQQPPRGAHELHAPGRGGAAPAHPGPSPIVAAVLVEHPPVAWAACADPLEFQGTSCGMYLELLQLQQAVCRLPASMHASKAARQAAVTSVCRAGSGSLSSAAASLTCTEAGRHALLASPLQH